MIHSLDIDLFGIDCQASRTQEQSLYIFLGFLSGLASGSISLGQNSSTELQPGVDCIEVNGCRRQTFALNTILLRTFLGKNMGLKCKWSYVQLLNFVKSTPAGEDNCYNILFQSKIQHESGA